MNNRLTLTFYSDILCVWAHIAQVRLDEVKSRFSGEVSIDYRFCSIFGDSRHNIDKAWRTKGGYEGFAKHLAEVTVPFDHVSLHPGIWQTTRPLSSAPAHLLLKAIQRVDDRQCESAIRELRTAFYEQCRDIGQRGVLVEILDAIDIDAAEVRAAMDSGLAHADLEADYRDQQSLGIQGSPTFILNDGRQKLYGNVGYGVIEANIRELLRSPAAGAASWC